MINFEELIPLDDWKEYLPVLELAKKNGIQLTLAGGLAFSEYAGRLRNTKDIDMLALRSDGEAMQEILKSLGWSDLYDREPYDRSWIFRGTKRDLICDIIWSLPNRRFEVNRDWLEKGGQVEIYGHWTRVISADYLILAKLYVFQRERCDWPDILNVLNYSCEKVNWRNLLKLIGRDADLLGGVLSVFRWLAPDKAKAVPAFVWKEVGLEPRASQRAAKGESRAFLLDTRDWFGPNIGGTKDCSSAR